MHADRELKGFNSCIALLLAVVGDENITPKREYAEKSKWLEGG
jgi:hypothetical protein